MISHNWLTSQRSSPQAGPFLAHASDEREQKRPGLAVLVGAVGAVVFFKTFLSEAVEGEGGDGAFETRSGQTPRTVGAAPAGEIVPFDPDQAFTHTSPAFYVRLGLELGGDWRNTSRASVVLCEKALAEEAESGAESGADTGELSGNRPLGAGSRIGGGAFAVSSCLSLKTDGWRNTLVILQICVRSWVIISGHVRPLG